VKEPQEIEDEEHEQVLERVAAVDVARASGWCVPGYPIRPGRAGGAFRPFTRLVAHDGSCFVAAKSAASSAGGYSRGALDRAGWLARSASPRDRRHDDKDPPMWSVRCRPSRRGRPEVLADAAAV
jgi:hypothetical protein